MYLKRDITSLLIDAMQTMPVVVLSGPRQSGKSTLLQQEPAFSSRRYYTLDDMAVLALARRDPDRLLEGDDPVTIDEAQRAPSLLLAIKRAVDARRQPGRFLLSGSANFLLLRTAAESLAGRALYCHLGPLSWRETRDSAAAPFLASLLAPGIDVAERLHGAPAAVNPDEGAWLRGGFPLVCVDRNADGWRHWFTGYRQTYMERDLRELTQVADLGLFDQFTQMMALRSAQVLNMRDVARDCGSNATTISRWLQILETGFLGQRLSPYYSNRVKRLVKAPKWYLADAGLMAYLTGSDPDTDLTRHPLRGALFETYVRQNLAALLDAWAPDARLLHYRSHTGHEVDFVVETPRALLAIEAKAGADVDARDLRGLTALLEAEPRCRAGIVAYQGARVRPLGSRLWAVPTGLLLS